MAKILIVDDQDTFLQINARVLQLDGHQVMTAQGGREALTLAQQEHPDLILLDIMMPGLDGNQVCQQIKENSDTQDIIVVMFTALPENRRFHSFRVGADHYLTKPVRPTQLREMIKQFLEQKGKR